MKLYLSSIFFFFCIYFGQSQSQLPILSVDNDVVDFGTIDQTANGRKSITITNTGQSPLIIHEVKGSCGCVILDFPKKPILSQQSAKIEFVYNVLKLGKISRTVTITSNAKKKKKIIKVKGKVVKSL
jgi:hypothetical protein